MLDRSLVRRDADAAASLRETVDFARELESLGAHRFWVSEHHSVPGIAGSAPAVLAAAIGQATSRIRVGTGGVMLPNHQPLVVAEQFGVLTGLFGPRIDLGLGRSVGFTPAVRAALGHDLDAAEDFDTRLDELLAFLTAGNADGVHARPGEGLDIPVFLLATGGGSAGSAARRGLPLVIAPARGRTAMREVIDGYRRDFRPCAPDSRPYVIVAVSVSIADTTEAAIDLLLPEAWSTTLSRTLGEFPPLWTPDQVRAAPKTARQERYLRQATANAIAGTEPAVAAELSGLLDDTGADEILAATSGFDRAEVLASHRRLATILDGLPS